MFNPCKHMKMTDSEYLYCSPPGLGNVSKIMEHETTETCFRCPDYETLFTEQELVELEQLLETNKKEDE